jgi:hypothetical protein
MPLPPSMIVDDLDLIGAVSTPHEADPPLSGIIFN